MYGNKTVQTLTSEMPTQCPSCNWNDQSKMFTTSTAASSVPSHNHSTNLLSASHTTAQKPLPQTS
jgi:hypothetical protein